MKKFKEADIWISSLLILLFTVLALYNSIYLFKGYFIVGGWQIISMLAHQFNKWFVYKGSPRNVYHLTVAVLAIIALLGLVVMPFMWVLAMVLIFAAPFMAVYYTILCYRETYNGMKRPLDHLK